MNKIVVSVMFDRNETGDFVKCCNCSNQLFLVEIGQEVCPWCETSGYLQWVDSDIEESSEAELIHLGYEVINE